MASLPTRTTASFDAIKPVSSLVLLDNEFNQYVGAAGIFNGGTTATKILVKTSDGTDPPVECDQVGAGVLARWKQNGSSKVAIENSGQINIALATGTAPLAVASTTVCANLNADMVDGRHLTGILVSFSCSFGIFDPTTPTINQSEFGSIIIPSGGTYTITKLKVVYKEGSHTAGGSVSFQVIRAGVGSIGTLTLDNTNNAANTVYTNDIGDISPSADEIFSVVVSARSGTVTERGVSVIIEGQRTAF